MVAVGTLLPRLATSLAAARPWEGDIAIGNIVGSNILDLFCIWGMSRPVTPSPLPSRGAVGLLVITGCSLVSFLMVISEDGPGSLYGLPVLAGSREDAEWLVVRSAT